MSGLTSDVYDEHLVDESSQYMLDGKWLKSGRA